MSSKLGSQRKRRGKNQFLLILFTAAETFEKKGKRIIIMDVGMSGYGFCAVKGSSKCQSDVGFSNIPVKVSYVLFRVASMLMDLSMPVIFMEAWNIEKSGASQSAWMQAIYSVCILHNLKRLKHQSDAGLSKYSIRSV